MAKIPTYTEAQTELQSIVTTMEQGNISVDELAEKVKRAAILIDICQKKLMSTEEEVSKILEELDHVKKEKEAE